MADVRSSGSRRHAARESGPGLPLGAPRGLPLRKVSATFRATPAPERRQRSRAPKPGLGETESGRPLPGAGPGRGPARGAGGAPGRRPRPAHFFVQSSRIPAKLRPPQLTVTSSAPLTTCSTRAGSRQPARGSMLRAPRPRPPRPPPGQPARDAARLTSQSSARGGRRGGPGARGRGRGVPRRRRSSGAVAHGRGLQRGPSGAGRGGAVRSPPGPAGRRPPPGLADRKRPRKGPEGGSAGRRGRCPGRCLGPLPPARGRPRPPLPAP